MNPFKLMGLATATAITTALGLVASAQAAPNVVFVVSDDLMPRIEGAKTPNLDALREHAVTFDHAYSQYPLCGPARASFLTGMRPNTIGHEESFEIFRCSLPDVVTLPQYFKNNGYASVRIGKMFHQGVPSDMGKPGRDDPQSWTHTINPLGRDREFEKVMTNHTPGEGPGRAAAFHVADVEDIELTDAISASEAIRQMDEKRDEPLFLAVGMYRPHVPEIVPRKYWDMYSEQDVQDRVRKGGDFEKTLFAARNASVANMGMSQEQQAEFLHSYYAAVSFVDAQVGKIVDELEAKGELDDTIFVFAADHGFMLGEHGMWEKSALFEDATRVPLIIAAPGIEGGKHVDTPVELLDLYPTLVELAGLPANDKNQGESLVPLMKNPDAEWTKPAVSQIFGGRTIRTGQYRYTIWGGGMHGMELYDYNAENPEAHNLVQDPDKAELVAQLNKQLNQIAPLQRGEVREIPPIQNPQGPAIPRPARPKGAEGGAASKDPCAGGGRD